MAGVPLRPRPPLSESAAFGAHLPQGAAIRAGNAATLGESRERLVRAGLRLTHLPQMAAIRADLAAVSGKWRNGLAPPNRSPAPAPLLH